MSIIKGQLEDEVAETHIEQQKLKASAEAIAFLSSIDVIELQKCMISDSLVAMSESGKELGELNVTVEFAYRDQQPCLLLRAHSQGAIEDIPCGTTVTAYLSTDLETLEHDHHEYLQLEGNAQDKRCHMVQRDGQMTITKVSSVGEVIEENVSYPLPLLPGLITEGSNLLLMRLMALRKTVPENLTFISFSQDVEIIQTTYRELGPKQLEIGCETVEVFGVERTYNSVEGVPCIWQCYFLPDGHLASRLQVGSPVTMRLLQLPPDPEQDEKPVFEKKHLAWEEDMEMYSKFLDRKEELKAGHESYLRQHPEVRLLLADFLQFLLIKKPDDILQFAKEYFIPFASSRIKSNPGNT